MIKKTYGVIGLGKFGSYITQGLIDHAESVVVCDNSQENFRDFREDVENLYLLDSTDVLALKEAGLADVDVAIVSIGDMEASILTVMALKELGSKRVIAKATSRKHGQILTKIGADSVIHPEREAANRLVAELISTKVDVTLISEDLKICKVLASEIFDKKTIQEIQDNSIKRDDLGNVIQEIKIISLKRYDKWIISPSLDFEINSEDFVVLLGNEKSIDLYIKKFEML